MPLASSPRTFASRANGSLSQGPVTAEGRAKAARNALKHGLTSAVPALLDGEDPAEFEAGRAAIQARLGAEGPLAADLVLRATWTAWLVRRADRLLADFLGRIQKTPEGKRPAGAALAEEPRLATAFRSLERHRARLQREHERTVEALLGLLETSDEDAQNEPTATAPPPPAALPSPLATPTLNRQQRRALARLAQQPQPKRLAVPPGHG